MSGATLVLDVETQRLAQEVGGWAFVDRLGLAAAVTLDVLTGEVRRYTEADATALVQHLTDASRIVGYNLIRFDYQVLKPYGLNPADLLRERRTIDLLDHLYRALGFYVSLDNVAGATLGAAKSADGFAAVTWYRQGLIDKVLDYCEQDVLLTSRLWQHGLQTHVVRIRDRNLRLRGVPVAWEGTAGGA
jgi:DEAD/DEAH box helicase domain-containing protein